MRFGEELSPPLTTVAQPIGRIATTAMQAIFEQLGDPTSLPTNTLLPVSLVERGSCVPAPTEG